MLSCCRKGTLCFVLILRLSAPYDPQASGRAERALQSLKIEGIHQMVHAGLSPPWWFHAVSQAAFLSRQRALDIALRKDAPQMGQLIAIKRHDHAAFEPRTLQGVMISYDDDCARGAFVLTTHKNGLKLHRARMPVLLNQEREIWNTSEAPDGSALVWLSMMCGEDVPTDLLTWSSGCRALRISRTTQDGTLSGQHGVQKILRT